MSNQLENGQVHDARTGFYDIKAPPNFTPVSYDSLLLALMVMLLVVGVLYFLYRKFKTKKPVPMLTMSPDEHALRELCRLQERIAGSEQDSFNPKEVGAEVSSIFRCYLETVFKFPAKEFTVKEVLKSFFAILEKQLRGLSSEQMQALLDKSKSVLNCAEILTFSDLSHSISLSKGSHVIEMIEQAKGTIRELACLHKREQERNQSVIATGLVTIDNVATGVPTIGSSSTCISRNGVTNAI